MPTLLHISDLHLGDVTSAQIAGDYKNELVPLTERLTRIRRLRNTLRELHLHLRERKIVLDSLVISGDIAVANAESGFQQLGEVLGELGTSLPSPNRIVIVPGNHDVAWKTPPSSSTRYERFLKYVRGAGYITPILDGVDAISASLDFSKHVLESEDHEYVIVPINSSNYCGSLEPAQHPDTIWGTLAASVPNEAVEDLHREFDRLRLHDVARISPQQFDALRALLVHVANRPGSGSPFRIAVLHHHLLPVSTSEEFKSFESISNLGLLRNFLRANRFDLVLHGHKHAEAMYWDRISMQDFDSRGRDVFVVSGATIGGTSYDSRDVCRLIAIEGHPLATTISITNVPAAEPGAAIDGFRTRRVPVWKVHQEPDPGLSVTIRDESFARAFARLRSVFDDTSRHTEIPLITVSLASAPTANEVALHYPEVPGVATHEKAAWLSDLVQWWQRPESALGARLHFTHGSRIHRYRARADGISIDQLARVVKTLENRDNGGRAVVILMDPALDEINTTRQKFPAFTMAQFLVRDARGEGLRLDCVGFFRKQEMRYWWPVNVLELSYMQTQVCARLQTAHRGLSAGSITTVTTLAVAGGGPPRVAVPAVDRALDENRDELWSYIYALFWEDMPNRSTYLTRWRTLLEDMIPQVHPEPDGVPVALDGLQFLVNEARRFVRHHDQSNVSEVVPLLQTLFEINSQYASEAAFTAPPPHVHEAWRKDVQALVAKMSKLIAAEERLVAATRESSS